MTKPTVDFSKIASSNPQHIDEWRYGLDFARLELERSAHKSEFLRWAKDNNVDDLDHFAVLADWRFLSVGCMAWLMNNGAEMPADSAEYFLRQMQELRNRPADIHPKDEEAEEPAMSVEARRALQYVNLYSFIDAVRCKHAADEEKLEEIIRKRIEKADPNMAMLRKVYQHFKDSLKDAIDGRQNPHVAAEVDALVLVVNILAGMTGNATALNASKKKVSTRVAKAVSKASVKNMDSETNLVGVSPAVLVGARSALVYNTKNRKAYLYMAREGSQLEIKGTYIINYDEEKTFGKTLRRPKEIFAKIMANPTTKRIDQVLDTYIKGKKHEANGKLNKDVMIIKVFK